MVLSACDKQPAGDKPTSTPPSAPETPEQQETTTPNEPADVEDTELSICDEFEQSYNMPLSFRKSVDERGNWPIPEPENAISEPEWCYLHTPEALPSINRYFDNEKLGNEWFQEELIYDAVTSLSYWTRESNPNGAMVWMIPDEPGTFIAIAIYTK